MKPDWKDAPEWANWLAMDGDGCWWWYECEPRKEKPGEWFADGEYIDASTPETTWDKTKEKRP